MHGWVELANRVLEQWGPGFWLERGAHGWLGPRMLGIPRERPEVYRQGEDLLWRVCLWLQMRDLLDAPVLTDRADSFDGELVGEPLDAPMVTFLGRLLPRLAWTFLEIEPFESDLWARFGHEFDAHGYMLSDDEWLLLPTYDDKRTDRPGFSREEFLRARVPREGASNPEEVDEPYYRFMIRHRWGGYAAGEKPKKRGRPEEANWSAARFGQSRTFLPDGRIVEVAGEHEDAYDPDFCIYNDVFVHHPDGLVRVLLYPLSVLPSTDFHTATLLRESLFLVGSLGYKVERAPGPAPVYRLDLRTFAIHPVTTSGDDPGRIFSHGALPLSDDELIVFGGKRLERSLLGEKFVARSESHVLNVKTGEWRRAELDDRSARLVGAFRTR